MPEEQIFEQGGGQEQFGSGTMEESPRPEAQVETPSTPENESTQTKGAYEKLLSQMSTVAPATDDVVTDATKAGLLEDEEDKVQHLIDLVVAKGLPHAVGVATKMKDAYALDRMHDELVDNFYQELLKKGIITEE